MAFSIYSYLREILKSESFKDQSNSEVAKYLSDVDSTIKETYNGRFSTLLSAISSIRRKEGLAVIKQKPQPKELKTPYKVSQGKYHFFPVKGEFSLPIEVVDDLFYHYSSKGLDLSSTEVRLKFNIQPHEWHALKNALLLYKAAHIFSPFTVENTTPEELQKIIQEKMDENINKISYRVQDEYNKSIIKKYKEVISGSAKNDLYVNMILDNIFEELPLYEIKPSVSIQSNGIQENLNVFLTDIHFGLSNHQAQFLPDYSPAKVKQILDEIANNINGFHPKKVNIFIGGDLIESFQGNNHTGSWKSLAEGMYGSTVVLEAYKSLVDFISKINNVKSFNLVPGNHDRSSSDNKEDVEGFVAKLIMEFIKVSYKDSDIEFNYKDMLLSKRVGNINFIMQHGHLGISKMNSAEIILEHGDPSCYNLLVQGHWHSRKVKSDSKNFRDIVLPAIMPGNHYSVTAGYQTAPGWTIVLENANKKPIIIDYSI